MPPQTSALCIAHEASYLFLSRKIEVEVRAVLCTGAVCIMLQLLPKYHKASTHCCCSTIKYQSCKKETELKAQCTLECRYMIRDPYSPFPIHAQYCHNHKLKGFSMDVHIFYYCDPYQNDYNGNSIIIITAASLSGLKVAQCSIIIYVCRIIKKNAEQVQICGTL